MMDLLGTGCLLHTDVEGFSGQLDTSQEFSGKIQNRMEGKKLGKKPTVKSCLVTSRVTQEHLEEPPPRTAFCPHRRGRSRGTRMGPSEASSSLLLFHIDPNH